MEKIETPLRGAVLLRPKIFRDERGEFVKPYHREIFRQFGLKFTFAEEFFSTSSRGVIRGMHLQVPPADHSKYVYCVEGSVMDVILDLRRASATYGLSYSIELNSSNRLGFYIPSGIAHGFVVLSEKATLVYQATSVYSPDHDRGIRWNSFGFEWGVVSPTISLRDRALPTLAEFNSPF